MMPPMPMDMEPAGPMGPPDGGDMPDMPEEPKEGGEGAPEGEDSELMDLIDSLSLEDKAAVKKYAESMADSKGDEKPDMGGGEPPMGDMPMENRQYLNNLVNEISDELMKRDRKRFDKNITAKGIGRKNPFVSNR